MSCNSSIAVVRVPFKKELSIEDIAKIMKQIESSARIDEYEGKTEYISVDEEKAKFRPRKIGDRWYLERIIEYNYEDNGDLNISFTQQSLDEYINELYMVGGVELHWQFKAHVWYNGSDEPE
jgi:hypothetical protein